MIVSLLKRLVPNRFKLFRHARYGKLGWHLVNADRTILQDQIIPYFAAQEDVKTIIDVGVEWYNKNYYRCFPDSEFHTIDFLPEMAKHGREGFHHTMSVTDLDGAFAENSLDLVLCNGPIGWGLNTREDIVEAMNQFARALRPGGYLVVGWNDREENRPGILPAEAASMAGFEPYELPPLKASSMMANEVTAHRYEFYRAGC